MAENCMTNENKIYFKKYFLKYIVVIIFIPLIIYLSYKQDILTLITIINIYYAIIVYFFGTTFTIINGIIIDAYLVYYMTHISTDHAGVVFNLIIPFFMVHLFTKICSCKCNQLNIKNKDEIKSFLNTINIPLIVLDSNKIIFYNKQAYNIISKVKSKCFCDIISKSHKKIFLDYLSNSIKTNKISITNINLSDNFNNKEVKLFIYPIHYLNKSLSLCFIIDDSCNEEKLKAEFYATLAHELRTPLNVILGSLQMMNLYIKNEQFKQKDNVNKYFLIMRQNCFRLLRIINNLIDATKIDAGYLNLNLNNYDIVNIVEGIVQSIVEYAKCKGIDVIFDTEIEELVIACDPDKIERVVLNLLSNAIKFTPAGGDINVYMSVEEDNVKVSIKDTGCGIPKDKLNTIFNRYTQVGNDMCRQNIGSGIGLSLVKDIIELHGGYIDVESKLNEGSTFTFTLPIKCVAECMENNIMEHNINVERICIEFSDIYSQEVNI